MLILCVILSGILLALAFPLSVAPLELALPTGNVLLEIPGMEDGDGFLQYDWVAYFALVPALYAFHRAKTVLYGCFLGMLMGLAWLLLHLNWIESFGWVPVLLMSLFYCLPYGLIGMFVQATRNSTKPWLIQWGLPVVWIAIEYIKTFGAWAFPWNCMGYSQANNQPLIQIADLGGVYLVSFMLLLVNAGIYLILADPGKFKLRLGHAALAGSLVLASFAYGEAQLELRVPDSRLLPYNLGLVQGGLDTKELWVNRDLESTLDNYIPESTEMLDKWDATADSINAGFIGPVAPRALLIAWPESVLPRRMSPRHPERLPHRIASMMSGREGSALMLGTLGRPHKEELNENGCLLVDEEAELYWAATKTRLVPFGEAVPFREIVRFLPFPWGSYNLDAGTEFDPLDWNGRRIGTLICFDNLFPFVSREQALEGAGSFVLITNNSWYKLHSGIRQHCDMDILRAVETRRPISRVATTGWSQIVDSNGRVTHQTGIEVAGTIETEIYPQMGTTVYMETGDLFAQLCVVIGVLTALISLVPGKSEGLL